MIKNNFRNLLHRSYQGFLDFFSFCVASTTEKERKIQLHLVIHKENLRLKNLAETTLCQLKANLHSSHDEVSLNQLF